MRIFFFNIHVQINLRAIFLSSGKIELNFSGLPKIAASTLFLSESYLEILPFFKVATIYVKSTQSNALHLEAILKTRLHMFHIFKISLCGRTQWGRNSRKSDPAQWRGEETKSLRGNISNIIFTLQTRMTPENVKGLPKFTMSTEKWLKCSPSTFQYEVFLWHGADICVQQC